MSDDTSKFLFFFFLMDINLLKNVKVPPALKRQKTTQGDLDNVIPTEVLERRARTRELKRDKHQHASQSSLVKGMLVMSGDAFQVVDEHASSKTCPFCFEDMDYRYYRKDGRLKRVNGAKRCLDPLYPTRKNGKNTMSKRCSGRVQYRLDWSRSTLVERWTSTPIFQQKQNGPFLA